MIYIDTETTGLSRSDEIIEMAVISDSGEVLFNSLIKPTQPIPAEATAIHGITDNDVIGAPVWSDIHSKVVHLLESADCVIAYNSNFDERMIRQTAVLYGLTVPSYRTKCVMKWVSLLTDSDWWISLSSACLDFGVDTEGLKSHRALGDCEMVLRLYQKLIKIEDRRGKQVNYRYRCYKRKMKLVPEDVNSYPFYGQSKRPNGWKFRKILLRW